MSQLPENLLSCLRRFGDEGWRERKQAVEELLHQLAVEQPDGPTMELLIEELLDLILKPESIVLGRDGAPLDEMNPIPISARAAAQEVVVQLGRVCLPKVLGRIQRGRHGVRMLVDVLGEIGGESEVPVLVNLLGDPQSDGNMRASAAAALGGIGGPTAAAALTELLADPSEMLQLYALDALRHAHAAVPVERLVPLLERKITRKAAVSLLGRSQSVDAVARLLPLLGDDMRGVRSAAAVAIVRLHHDSSETGKRVVETAVADIGDAGLRRVRDLIEHPDPDVGCAAIELATMACDAQALPHALTRMEEPLAYERTLDLVTRLGEAANAALAELLDGLEIGLREAVFRLIGAVRAEVVDPRLVAVLMEALEDPLEPVAIAASDSLRRMGGRAALAPLYRACARPGAVGEHAAEALAEVAARSGGGRYDDLMLLIGGTWPQAGPLAMNLCRVVGRLGLLEFVPPLVSMLGSLDVPVRVAAAHALGQIPGEHEGLGALSFALADEEPQVRASACRSLGQLGAPSSVQPLLSATSDPAPLVRAAAVQALVMVDNPISLARMREIIMDDGSTAVVVHAIAGLGHSGHDQDLIMLMSLCSSEDHEVVKAAARGLTAYAAHRATAALLGLLSHPRWDVRWAAAEVLAERGDITALASLQRALDLEADDLVRQILEQAVGRLADLSGAFDGKGGG